MQKWFLLVLLLASCGTRSSNSSFLTVQDTVQSRIGSQITWRSEAYAIKARLLEEIQRDGLSRERAVQLALINNPNLFAFYETLEIGYADLLEAGLLLNPIFAAKYRIPDNSRFVLNIIYDAAISFIDFFLVPLRKQAAEAEIRVIEAEIMQKVLDLARDVELDWLEVKALELQIEQETERAEIKQLAADLAALQLKAGNRGFIYVKAHIIEAETAWMQLENMKAHLASAREKLSRSLGLLQEETSWHTTGEMQVLELPDVNQLEVFTTERRFDIEAIRREIQSLAKQAKLKEWWTYSNLFVGVSSERHPDRLTTTGPSFALSVPIFNHGQGQRKRIRAKISEAQQRLLATVVKATSEVREFYQVAALYKSQLEVLEKVILPDFQQQLTSAEAHYNVMTLGVYQLMDFKEREMQAKIQHLQATKDYLQARTKLIYAAGGSSQ